MLPENQQRETYIEYKLSGIKLDREELFHLFGNNLSVFDKDLELQRDISKKKIKQKLNEVQSVTFKEHMLNSCIEDAIATLIELLASNDEGIRLNAAKVLASGSIAKVQAMAKAQAEKQAGEANADQGIVKPTIVRPA